MLYNNKLDYGVWSLIQTAWFLGISLIWVSQRVSINSGVAHRPYVGPHSLASTLGAILDYSSILKRISWLSMSIK